MIGQVFGNYKVTQKLGEGGMGEVYRGVDMMLEREVAIKFLRPEELDGDLAFEHHVHAAVDLAHPALAELLRDLIIAENLSDHIASNSRVAGTSSDSADAAPSGMIARMPTVMLSCPPRSFALPMRR